MKLFQYWDTGEPPDDVAAWIEGFRAMNPDFKHRLYDRGSASWFIRKNLGQRHQRAFDALLVPSVQSDYLRLCAVSQFGGAYLDADFECLEPLSTLLAEVPDDIVMVWEERLVSGFMLFRQPRAPFLLACLELATQNIEARDMGGIYAIAGPPVLCAVRSLLDPAYLALMNQGFNRNEKAPSLVWPRLMARARNIIPVTPELRASLEAIRPIHALALARWMGTPQPAYKAGPRHWVNWEGPVYA
jgi:hypothetical protein